MLAALLLPTLAEVGSALAQSCNEVLAPAYPNAQIVTLEAGEVIYAHYAEDTYLWPVWEPFPPIPAGILVPQDGMEVQQTEVYYLYHDPGTITEPNAQYTDGYAGCSTLDECAAEIAQTIDAVTADLVEMLNCTAAIIFGEPRCTNYSGGSSGFGQPAGIRICNPNPPTPTPTPAPTVPAGCHLWSIPANTDWTHIFTERAEVYSYPHAATIQYLSQYGGYTDTWIWLQEYTPGASGTVIEPNRLEMFHRYYGPDQPGAGITTPDSKLMVCPVAEGTATITPTATPNQDIEPGSGWVDGCFYGGSKTRYDNRYVSDWSGWANGDGIYTDLVVGGPNAEDLIGQNGYKLNGWVLTMLSGGASLEEYERNASGFRMSAGDQKMLMDKFRNGIYLLDYFSPAPFDFRLCPPPTPPQGYWEDGCFYSYGRVDSYEDTGTAVWRGDFDNFGSYPGVEVGGGVSFSTILTATNDFSGWTITLDQSETSVEITNRSKLDENETHTFTSAANEIIISEFFDYHSFAFHVCPAGVPTPTPEPTSTLAPPTRTPPATFTPQASRTPTNTPTATITPTITPTWNPLTPTPTPTATGTATATGTPYATSTPRPTSPTTATPDPRFDCDICLKLTQIIAKLEIQISLQQTAVALLKTPVVVNVPTDDPRYEQTQVALLETIAAGGTASTATSASTATNTPTASRTPTATPALPRVRAEVSKPGAVRESAGFVAVNLVLSQPHDKSVSVHWETQAGSAVGVLDYVPWSEDITFAPGETVKTVQIIILDDDEGESDESFSVVLSSPDNALLDDFSSAMIQIQDDDRPATPTASNTPTGTLTATSTPAGLPPSDLVCRPTATLQPTNKSPMPDLALVLPTIRPLPTLFATIEISAHVMIDVVQTAQSAIETPMRALETSTANYDWEGGELLSQTAVANVEPGMEWVVLLNPTAPAWTEEGSVLWALAPFLGPLMPIISISLLVVIAQFFLWMLKWLLRLLDIIFGAIELIPGE